MSVLYDNLVIVLLSLHTFHSHLPPTYWLSKSVSKYWAHKTPAHNVLQYPTPQNTCMHITQHLKSFNTLQGTWNVSGRKLKKLTSSCHQSSSNKKGNKKQHASFPLWFQVFNLALTDSITKSITNNSTYIHLYPVLVGEYDSFHNGSIPEAETEWLTEKFVDKVDIVPGREEHLPHQHPVLAWPVLLTDR